MSEATSGRVIEIPPLSGAHAVEWARWVLRAAMRHLADEQLADAAYGEPVSLAEVAADELLRRLRIAKGEEE